ncbi:SDR family NAD(P)-dependent oxidoreductase [Jongsikchunia kroppenstedtii]|uniref:SDR family NAD(P)-dependent oxidoreductase n=1 Tax=Jongsikchunia kroppenstedtii TaxID=1121721 RepID=UPI000373BBA5|nr:SDR family NAD(P)-dependent oxidoreductase [Jongsikchunia kroppenstedtii]
MKINTLKPELVVVTGAGSGIGEATATRFAKNGAHVIVSDIDLEAAKVATAKMRGLGLRASAAQLDVTDPAAWDRFALDVHADHGIPDVLVNNAGMLVGGSFLDLEPEHWDKQLSVNLMGVVYGCRAVGRLMVERGSGHIVNICSAAALSPTAVMAAYHVSKAGVKMLTECLRLELGAKGVGVSAICPGVINTSIGNNAITVGVDHELVERGQRISQRVQEIAAKLPFAPMSPNLVARAAVRSVRFDLAIVPVRSEAWFGYFMGRIAPGINRTAAGGLSVERGQELGHKALGTFAPILERILGEDVTSPATPDPADSLVLSGPILVRK